MEAGDRCDAAVIRAAEFCRVNKSSSALWALSAQQHASSAETTDHCCWLNSLNPELLFHSITVTYYVVLHIMISYLFLYLITYHFSISVIISHGVFSNYEYHHKNKESIPYASKLYIFAFQSNVPLQIFSTCTSIAMCLYSYVLAYSY